MTRRSSFSTANPESFSGGVGELAAAVNAWAKEKKVFPVSGQAAREVSVRNLRYYRSQALLDGPLEGGGYGPKHFLQVAAIRLLQANGLPLAHIRDLLYGRSEEELVGIFRDGVAELHRSPEPAEIVAPGETCQLHGLEGGFALLIPNGRSLSAVQLEAINQILRSNDPPSKNKPNPKPPKKP